MIKHYAYRMDHDTGFAPHTSDNVCTLCGCKSTSVERWANPGSWVIGIGGNGTGKPDMLVYALQVEATPSLAQLRHQSPQLVAYLRRRSLDPSSRVLVSQRFYYFGTNAIPVPAGLERLLIRTQGCKKVEPEDVNRLVEILERRFSMGVHGRPNNPDDFVAAKCACGPTTGGQEENRGGPVAVLRAGCAVNPSFQPSSSRQYCGDVL